MKTQRMKNGFGMVELIILISLIAIGVIVAITFIGSPVKEKLFSIDEKSLEPLAQDGNPQPANAPAPIFEGQYEIGEKNNKPMVSISITPTGTEGQPLRSVSVDLKDLDPNLSKIPFCHAEIAVDDIGFDPHWNCGADGTTVTCTADNTQYWINSQVGMDIFFTEPIMASELIDRFDASLDGGYVIGLNPVIKF